MTNVFPINGELAGYPLASKGAAALQLPQRAIECFREGVGRLRAGDAAAALTLLEQSVQHAPNFSEAHVFLGLANALESNIYPAVDHLELAARLEPQSFAAHFTLAQLHFKLRVPQKGYEAAEHARRCIGTLEQRKMLTDLLKEERARERNGIARPTFDKPFSLSALVLAGGGLLAALITVVVYLR